MNIKYLSTTLLRLSKIANIPRYTMTSAGDKIVTTKLIGTHDGTFHCDDVTACYMLKQLDRFKEHEIIRTRDKIKLAQAEIVVDVGSELDVDKLRLDHHQRSFVQTIKDYHPNIKSTNPNKPVRLSSSGLVFAIFGKDLIVKLLNFPCKLYNELDDSDKKKVDDIYAKAYSEFFEEIDAIDNGVEIASGEDVTYNYHINSGLSNRVARLNPINDNATDEQRLEHFKKAMEVVGSEIVEGIQFLGNIWWPQRQSFKSIILDRKKFDPSGQILLMNASNLVGWKSAVFEFEEELGIVGEVKFVIFQTNTEESPWRATGVSSSLKSFSLRVPLKEEWRGKRDQELQEVSGIADATFVHMSGFTGGAKSLAGAKSLVRKTLGLE